MTRSQLVGTEVDGLPGDLFEKLLSDALRQSEAIQDGFIEALYSKRVSDEPGEVIPILDERGQVSCWVRKHAILPSPSASDSGIRPALA